MAAHVGDDLSEVRSLSHRSAGGSTRNWGPVSLKELLRLTGPDVFQTSWRQYDDEKELIWAAVDKIPTKDRAIKDDNEIVQEVVDVENQVKQLLLRNLENAEEDNEKFLPRLRERTDSVGIETPDIEVRYEHLSIEGDVYVGSRSLPTLLNSTLNVIESVFEKVKIVRSKKSILKILDDVSGIVKPSRMTLLLGPPGSGKTTFLKALSGDQDKDLRMSGRITYCGNEMSEFIPQKTCSYISQYDLHHGEMTVRETLKFSGRCLGVRTRNELLQLSRREKAEGVKPDSEIDPFMKATSATGQESNLVTDHIIKILGLEMCADILVGDELRRGISGGEKKRLTTGEMLVGSAKVFYMDGISTGLDCSTTFQILNYMRQMVHIMNMTMIISLLQPAPEIFELFDDIILLSERKIIYQGPRENILEFFESVGFKCPERKGVADFLQEVTSRNDQGLYWFKKDETYKYVSAADFLQHFGSFHIGQKLFDELSIPFDKTKVHPAALVMEKYGISNMELFKACFSREWLLMKRNSALYIFNTFQITVMAMLAFTVFFRTEMPSGQLVDGGKYYGALFFGLLNVMLNGMSEIALTIMRLPVFFKQRDALFYPAWAFSLPIWFLRIPLSLVESLIWIILTYYTIGFAPGASRFFRQLLAFFAMNQMGLSLFRLVAAIGRTLVISNSLGTFSLLVVFVMGGYIISRDDVPSWLFWGSYASPMMYGQNALAINEFLDTRWSTPNSDPMFDEPTVGRVLLRSRGMFQDDYMYWICVAAILAFSIMFNILFILALTHLNPLRDSRYVVDEDTRSKKMKCVNRSTGSTIINDRSVDLTASIPGGGNSSVNGAKKKGMLLPFTPLSLAFSNVNYYVDMPAEMKNQGIEENRLQLLRDVSGSFRPGVLTALVGVSGAGKTTLMDVLAGRKTGGYIDGSISISGYPKNQTTFARVSGYCEQNDIHSPHVTVYESIVFSAWLRLSPEIKKKTCKMFVEEVMSLIELTPLSGALVGLPGVDGLSTEQRKRLTIAVELIANPSIIFMDEPTSGLDARAAAIVMRTVRNTVDTGRTVLCTIHQPSIDIFESFDELLLLKRGGQVIYAGPLGHHSCQLIQYFQSVPGVPEIKEDYNPASWMLDITTPSMEAKLSVDFAELYANSDLYRMNNEQIKQLSTQAPGSEELHFPTKYTQTFVSQCKACLWKQHLSYWRNPQYNGFRFLMTAIIGLIFGTIYWNKGEQVSTQQDLINLFGAMYAAVIFLGGTNTSAVQSVVSVERTVFYREKAAGMYSSLPLAFAQVAVEIEYLVIQTFLYCIILYTMIGFPWIAANFFWFYFYIFMSFTYYTLYGMMLVALTPNYMIAAVLMLFFLSFWNLFSGFIIPRTQIPIWWRWYYWASPVSWTLYGVITSQVGNMNNLVEVLGVGNIPMAEFLERFLGFKYDFLGVVALAHVGWAILFFIGFVYGIKYLNFQRR